MYFGPVDTYLSAPLFPPLIQPDPFISRAAIAGTLLSVAYVLREGGRAQIGLAIIKTVVIDVIDQHIIGDFAYLAVHEVPASFARSVNPISRVERRAALGGKPFISGEPEEIVRIDEGELALSQRYPAERIAVPNAPI